MWKLRKRENIRDRETEAKIDISPVPVSEKDPLFEI